jgi:hypothetical protein
LEAVALALETLVKDAQMGDHGLRLVVVKLSGSEGSFAIKDDDFPLIQTAVTMVAAVLSGGNTWAPGLIAGILVLLVQFYRKRIQLSPIQAAILQELRSYPGITDLEIAALLDLHDVTQSVVAAELGALKQMTSGRGELVELVTCDDNGRWYARGV